MNQQTNMADMAAADLVQGIATRLYGDAGAGITDLIELANRVQADMGTPVSPCAAGQGGGRLIGWSMIDGMRVFSVSAHASILDPQQFVRYDDHLAALATVQPSPAVQGDALGTLVPTLRAMASNYSGGHSWDHLDADVCLRAADALDARQPVGQEPVGVSLTCGHEGWSVSPWDAFGLPTVGKRVTVYAAPPAQAVDLGQQKDAARYRWVRDHYDPSIHDGDDDVPFFHIAGGELDAAIDDMIDSGKAVGNG